MLIRTTDDLSSPIPAPDAGAVRSLSFFFPAHNEEAHVERMVEDALRFLPGVVESFEIIIVDDGSTDGTLRIARSLEEEHPEVRVVSHPVNRGYGAALKSGFRAATKPWVFFTDGDCQFDIRELEVLLEVAAQGAGAVVGYRRKRQDPFHRCLNAWMYRLLLRLTLGLRFRDVDCAFKLLPTALVQSLGLQSDGALISAELLYKLRRTGVEIWEVGVSHYPRTAGLQSGASIRVIARMFRELFLLRLRLAREPVATAEPPSTSSAVRRTP